MKNKEQQKIQLVELIISSLNYKLNHSKQLEVTKIVLANFDDIPSQIAFKVLTYLKQPLLENSLNLTNLIDNFKKGIGQDVHFYRN